MAKIIYLKKEPSKNGLCTGISGRRCHYVESKYCSSDDRVAIYPCIDPSIVYIKVKEEEK